MNKSETAAMLILLKQAYPAFYSKMSKADFDSTICLWQEMFADEDISLVKPALKALIATHSGYPPDIATVKNKISEIYSEASGEPTDEKLWQLLRKAIGNGLYGAKEEFDALPDILQSYLGDPSALTELAMIDVQTLNTVKHGQFLKQIKIMRERTRFRGTLPDDVRQMISGAANQMSESRGLIGKSKL